MNSTIDFGNINYEPRLRRLVASILRKCDSSDDFNAWYNAWIMLSINDYCKLTLNKRCNCDECSGCGSEDIFIVSIMSNSTDGGTPRLLCRVEIEREICDETPDVARETIVSEILDSINVYSNLRAIPMCIYCSMLIPCGDVYCQECRDRTCKLGEDEMCSICQDDDFKEAIWHELTCKHVFHAHCIEKVRTADDDRRKSHFSCPLCRAEINKSTGFKML